MQTLRYAFVIVLLALVACSDISALQKSVLTPLNIKARLGGSVRELLQAHPNHQSAGDGMYYFQTSSPSGEKRTVRIRGEGDTIFWLQVQDETIAAEANKEHRFFENEVDRLEGILGHAKQQGVRTSSERIASWTQNEKLKVIYRLDISAEPVFARRTLTIVRIK